MARRYFLSAVSIPKWSEKSSTFSCEANVASSVSLPGLSTRRFPTSCAKPITPGESFLSPHAKPPQPEHHASCANNATNTSPPFPTNLSSHPSHTKVHYTYYHYKTNLLVCYSINDSVTVYISILSL